MSFGSKLYCVRHFGQKPFVRPGWPSWPRPTGEPHTEQKRLSSATAGESISAWRGSTAGIDGTGVRPAPSREVEAPRSADASGGCRSRHAPSRTGRSRGGCSR